jgi:hypothetical protein
MNTGDRGLSRSQLSNRDFQYLLAEARIVVIVLHLVDSKRLQETMPPNYLQELAHGIRDEGCSLGIPQSRVYRHFQLPISMPFPCRSGKQTNRLTHAMILECS